MGVTVSALDAQTQLKRINLLANKCVGDGFDVILRQHKRNRSVSVYHSVADETQFNWFLESLFKNSEFKLDKVCCKLQQDIDQAFGSVSMDQRLLLSTSNAQATNKNLTINQPTTPELFYLRKKLQNYSQYDEFFDFEEEEIGVKMRQFTKILVSISRLVEISDDELPEDLLSIAAEIYTRLSAKNNAPQLLSNAETLENSRKPGIKPLRYVTALERQILTRSAAAELQDELGLNRSDIHNLSQQVSNLRKENADLIRQVQVFRTTLSHELQQEIEYTNVERELTGLKRDVNKKYSSTPLVEAVGMLVAELNSCNSQLISEGAENKEEKLINQKLNEQILELNSQLREKQSKIINMQRSNGQQQDELIQIKKRLTKQKEVIKFLNMQVKQQIFQIRKLILDKRDFVKLLLVEGFTGISQQVTSFSEIAFRNNAQLLKIIMEKRAIQINLEDLQKSHQLYEFKNLKQTYQLLLNTLQSSGQQKSETQDMNSLIDSLITQYSNRQLEVSQLKNSLDQKVTQLEEQNNYYELLQKQHSELIQQHQSSQVKLFALESQKFDYEIINKSKMLLQERIDKSETILQVLEMDFDTDREQFLEVYDQMKLKLEQSCENSQNLTVNDLITEILYQALKNSQACSQMKEYIQQIWKLINVDQKFNNLEEQINVILTHIQSTIEQNRIQDEKIQLQNDQCNQLKAQVEDFIVVIESSHQIILEDRIAKLNIKFQGLEQKLLQVEEQLEQHCLSIKNILLKQIKNLKTNLQIQKQDLQKKSLGVSDQLMNTERLVMHLTIQKGSQDSEQRSNIQSIKQNLQDLQRQLLSAKSLLSSQSINEYMQAVSNQLLKIQNDRLDKSGTVTQIKNVSVSLQNSEYLANQELQKLSMLFSNHSDSQGNLKAYDLGLQFLKYVQNITQETNSTNLYDAVDVLAQTCQTWIDESDELQKDNDNLKQQIDSYQETEKKVSAFLKQYQLNSIADLEVLLNSKGSKQTVNGKAIIDFCGNSQILHDINIITQRVKVVFSNSAKHYEAESNLVIWSLLEAIDIIEVKAASSHRLSVGVEEITAAKVLKFAPGPNRSELQYSAKGLGAAVKLRCRDQGTRRSLRGDRGAVRRRLRGRDSRRVRRGHRRGGPQSLWTIGNRGYLRVINSKQTNCIFNYIQPSVLQLHRL